MKITNVLYQATLSTGSYENEKIGLQAEVEEGETVEAVVEALREQVYKSAHREDALYQRRNLQIEISTLESKVEQARKVWEEVSTFMTAQGLKTEPAPFPTLLKAIAPMSESTVVTVVDEDDINPFEDDPLADD
jgi:hypothetical protein